MQSSLDKNDLAVLGFPGTQADCDFDLLGWRVSGGDKDLPFSDFFKALGVQISLDNWTKGIVLMQNTEKRILELSGCIDKALREGTLSSAAALSLRGRMQFANSQVWGRASKICLKQVALAYNNNSSKVCDEQRRCPVSEK